jgi:hypothetical protein
MTITAQSILERATDLLQDKGSIRWTMGELVRWLNDAQRTVIKLRPDSMNVTATMTLATGPRQDLDDASFVLLPVKLVEITRNVAATSKKKAVRLVERSILDAHEPGWYSLPSTVNIQHYTFDPRDPKTFYSYPPATTLAQLEVKYSAYPSDIDAPADNALYGDVTGDISLPDIYADDLLNIVMFRAYSKDAEFSDKAALAANYLTLVTASLGAEIQATLAVGPKA